MSVNKQRAKAISLLIGSMMFALISGCAEMQAQGGTNGTAASDGPQPSDCNPLVAGAIGGVVGSLFGKGKGHLVGAAAGAGIGALACMAYNYHSLQVRDAKAVSADYVRQRGALPASNTVSSYTSAMEPSSTVKAGGQAEMQSRIVVVNGTQDVAPKLSETLTLFSPDGKQLSTVTKPATDINGTGEYQTSFNFNLPKGIKEGRYVVRSTLNMNNQRVSSNEVPMVVVG